MATTATINNSGSGSPAVGKVMVVNGTVQAQASDGSMRILEVGSPVFMGERIITGGDGMVSIVLEDGLGTRLDLGRMSEVLVDADLFPGEPGDFSEAVAEVEQVQQALIAGDFDPTTDFEPTAAGPAAAGPADDGGGSSYVEFDLTGAAVTPTSGAETTGVGLNFLDPLAPQFEEPEEPVVFAAIAPAEEPAPADAPLPPAEPPIIPPPPPPPPVDFAPSVGSALRILDEENLDDGTNPDNAEQDESFDPDRLVTSGTLADLGVDFGPDGPGSLTFTNFDGSGTETIPIDGNPANTVNVVGQYGTLVIDGTGAWTYILDDNVSHPNAGQTGSDDIVSDPFSIIVIDGNGTPAGPGSLTIDIYDDGPEARDAAIARVLEEEALDNYSPGASPVEGSDGNPDPFDGPEDDTQPDAHVVTGSLASLVDMGADNPGTFSIVIPPGLPELYSKGGMITYEMNVNGTTLEAWVRLEPPPEGEVALAARTQEFPGEGQGGDRLVFTLDVQPDGSYTFTLLDQLDHVEGDGENTLLLSGDGESVADLALGAAIVATDSDGDSTGFVDRALTFTIVDDVPRLVHVGQAFFFVSEDALGNDNPSWNPWNNADGDSSTGNLEGAGNLLATDRAYFNLSSLVKTGADEQLTWTLRQPPAEEVPEEGQGDFGIAMAGDYASSLTSKGETVYYRVDGNTLTGYTGSPEAMQVIFTLTVDGNSGWAVFDLDDQLDHNAGEFGADYNFLRITDLGQFVVASDYDGDTVDLGDRLVVKVENDIPEGDAKVKIFVQEDALGNRGDGGDQSLGLLDSDDDVEQVTGSLAAAVKPGADESLTFRLKDVSNVDSGLKSNGEKVYFNTSGNTLTATAGSTVVFTFTVAADGAYAFDLEDQLDHSGKYKDDDSNLSFDLGRFVEASDADNDTIDLTGLVKIYVENDVPMALVEPRAIVGEVLEDGLSLGEGDLSEGLREAGEGLDSDETDGDGATSLATLFASGADEALRIGITTDQGLLDSLSELSSKGEQLSYSSDGSTLTATTGSGREVFTLAVNDDGSWKFDLKDQLDHVAGDGENWSLRSGDGSVDGIDFSAVITATDADGDTVTGVATGAFVVKVQDDVPDATFSGSSFFVSEFAGFDNIIGTYRLDENGNPVDAKIFLASSNDAVGGGMGQLDPNTPMGDFVAGTKFFLVANGASTDLGDLNNLRFVENPAYAGDPSAPQWILEIDGSTSYGTPVYYMDVALNADGKEHFKDENGNFLNAVPPEGGEIRIEDLSLGDADYDDTVLRVQVGPAVDESSLPDGSDPGATPLTVGGNLFTGVGGVKVFGGADEPGSLTVNANAITTTNTGGNLGAPLTLLMDGSGDFLTVFSEAGRLEIHDDGRWYYTLENNTLVHPDNDKGGSNNTDGDSDRGTGDQVQDIFDLTFTDADGDSVAPQLVININDDGPSAAEDVDAIVATVEEDDMALTDGDFSAGYNEDGSVGMDEASSLVSGTLAGLFNVGADNDNVTYGLTDNFTSLGDLQSKGQPLSYDIVRDGSGDTLVATSAGGNEVFTLHVNGDGSWAFDLKDQLDHELDGNTEGYVLKGSTAPDGEGIDFSSALMVTDADGDTALGAADNSFVVKVQDDIPVAREVETVPANLNLVLILDKSGSMGDNKIKFDGTDGITRMAALQTAVVGLLGELDSSAAENVRVHIVAYDTEAQAIGTFNIRSNGAGGIDLVDATTQVNAINAGGFTNYEAGYQQALHWVNTGNPLTSADVGGQEVINQVIFISDGDPNRWNDPDYDGTNHHPQGSSTSTAMAQVSNEITLLAAWADSVRAIGINVSGTQDNRLDTLDSTGDALNIDDGNDLVAVLPQLLVTTTPLITATVLEDGLDAAIPGDDDNATGNKESGETSDDDQTGGLSGQNLAALFTVGADEELTFSMAHVSDGLPRLYSGGQPVEYSFSSNTLTAHVGGETVFTFTINEDGSWHFDLDGPLDHVAGDGENLELLSGDDMNEAITGIDLSALVVASDADGDTVTANRGAFVISVEDDMPEAVAPAYDAILASEAGNSLVADLNLEAGADGYKAVVINPLDKEGNPVEEGDKVYSNGEKLIVNGKDVTWQESDGRWSAVARGGVVLFTVAPEVVAGAFTGNYTVEQVNDFATEKNFFLKFSTQAGAPVEEKVFVSDGVKMVVTADSPSADPDLVNPSNQGLGVDNNLINEVNGVPETLKFVFSGLDDQPLDMTQVTLEFDHLDNPPHDGLNNAEHATWKAYSYDDDNNRVEVGSGSFPGITGGTSTDVEYTVKIDGGDTTFQELEVSIISPDTAEGFRIESIKGEYEENTEYVFDFQAEVTDGDGDSATTEFSVTFETDDVLAGGDGAEVIAGSSLSDVIEGGGGDDIVIGGAGDDTIDGGEGDDVLFGGEGEDTLAGGEGNDTLVGGPGKDALDGEEGEDTLFPDDGNVDDGVVDQMTGGGNVAETDTFVDPGNNDTATDFNGAADIDLETLIPPPEEPVV